MMINVMITTDNGMIQDRLPLNKFMLRLDCVPTIATHPCQHAAFQPRNVSTVDAHSSANCQGNCDMNPRRLS
jgi:hypothetical protein